MKYKIKAGNHYSNFNLGKLWPFASERRGKVKFSIDCWYSKDSIPKHGWNKLTGIAQLFGVHKRSGRIVWQPNFESYGAFDIAGYVYRNGNEWTAVKFAAIRSNIWYDYYVKYEDGKYTFMINGMSIEMTGKKPILPRKCYCYFGGQSTAPHNMIIEIK